MVGTVEYVRQIHCLRFFRALAVAGRTADSARCVVARTVWIAKDIFHTGRLSSSVPVIVHVLVAFIFVVRRLPGARKLKVDF